VNFRQFKTSGRFFFVSLFWSFKRKKVNLSIVEICSKISKNVLDRVGIGSCDTYFWINYRWSTSGAFIDDISL